MNQQTENPVIRMIKSHLAIAERRLAEGYVLVMCSAHNNDLTVLFEMDGQYVYRPRRARVENGYMWIEGKGQCKIQSSGEFSGMKTFNLYAADGTYYGEFATNAIMDGGRRYVYGKIERCGCKLCEKWGWDWE